MMLTTKKIIGIGKSSLAITLPKEIAENLEKGDTAVFSIHLVQIIDSKIKSYICKGCMHRFCQSNDDSYDAYCPACGIEDVEEEEE